MGELILIFALLLMGFAIYMGASVLISTNEDNASLSWATGEEPNQSKSKLLEFSRPLVHRFTMPLVSKVKSINYRKRVEHKILTSGLSSELSVNEFIGLQFLWGLLFPALLFLMNFTLELGYSPILLAMMGVGGVYLPHMHVNNAKKERMRSVVADLPFFIDLLALSTEAAGMDFITAIERVVEKAEDSVLADELGIVLRDIKLGSSRAEALKAFSERLDMPEITSFVVVVVDAEASGTSIGKVLKDQSVQMRLERITRAEKEGARASQLILIPLMMFILPAVFVMVFGPVVLQFLSGGN